MTSLDILTILALALAAGFSLTSHRAAVRWRHRADMLQRVVDHKARIIRGLQDDVHEIDRELERFLASELQGSMRRHPAKGARLAPPWGDA